MTSSYMDDIYLSQSVLDTNTTWTFSHTIRNHKTLSSKDFRARMKFEVLMKLPPPELEKLYCFNSQSSYDQIETILGETDVAINHQQLHA